MLIDQASCVSEGMFCHMTNLFINEMRSFRRIVLLRNEGFAAVFALVTDKAKSLTHAPFKHHGASNPGDHLDVHAGAA